MNDEVMSWWNSRPRHDRKGNLRPVTRKDGKISYLYRHRLGGKIQPAINFGPDWTPREIKDAIKKIEGEIHAVDVAMKMGFQTTNQNGGKIKSPTLMELLVWHLREALQKGNSVRTVKNKEADFTDFMDFIGDPNTRVSDLTLKQMYDYQSHLRKTCKPLTIKNRITLINVIFRDAKFKQRIEVNPFADFRYDPVPPSEERDILTAAEMRKIADMIWNEKRAHWQKIWLAWQIARFTGMRGADILRLRFENIDFENKTLSFRMPKRKNKLITIPIRSSLFSILEKLKGHKGLIFDFKKNLKFREQILIKHFAFYIRKLKGDGFKRPGSHPPRHSLNQIMYDNNVSLEHRCFILGQKLGGSVQATYLHQTKQHMDAIRQVLESLPLD